MAGYDGIDDALDTTSETLEVKPVKKQKPDRLTKSDVD